LRNVSLLAGVSILSCIRFYDQMSITQPSILQAIDRSILETIEAFVRFRPGFHGDTGIRDYLYHRLMTNLPNGGVYERTDGGGTLLAQAEWYTALKYRRTGGESSLGRFDIGIPNPEELDLDRPHPLAAFECGRNKKVASLLSDIDAMADHEGPEPGDITKLAREIRHKDLPFGYALEFFDKGMCSEAEYLIGRLQPRISAEAESNRLHIVVLVYIGDKAPMLTFLPPAWGQRIRLNFEAELERIECLMCVSVGTVMPRRSGMGASRTNRVSREDFLTSCSVEARALIEAVEQRFRGEVKLVFGGNTMTVNRQTRGTLLRIQKAPNCVSQLDPVISEELAALFKRPIQNSKCEISATQDFREAVVKGLDRTL
jgi:hypothetical protein